MLRSKSLLRALVVACIVCIIMSPCAFAQVEPDYEFYKGKVIKFIVPYSVGGGFDVYARAIVPFIEKYIPGATVVVQNVPGGGSIIGTNTLYRAKPDGLTIGIVNGAGIVLSQAAGVEGVQFDVADMEWLAQAAADPRAILVNPQSGFETFEDMIKAGRSGRTVVLSHTGVGSDDFYGSYIIFRAFGIPLRNITGFPGAAEANLAAARGEGIDGTECEVFSVLPYVDDGSLKPILMITHERDRAFPDVPCILEVVEGLPEGTLSDESREQIQTITEMFIANRVIGAPSGIPAERSAVLKEALEKALTDPELIEWAEKTRRPLDYLPGEIIDPIMKEGLRKATLIKDILSEAEESAR